MAKSWVTQKRLKAKTYREKTRGIMRQYSAARVNCGASPNKEIMEWYKNSARGLGVPYEEVARLNVNWPNDPRKEALAKRKELIEKCSSWLYFRIIDDSFLRARLYYTHNPERCCIVELDKRRKRMRRSIVYRNRDVAYQRWVEGTIDWVDKGSEYHKNIPETFEN